MFLWPQIASAPSLAWWAVFLPQWVGYSCHLVLVLLVLLNVVSSQKLVRKHNMGCDLVDCQSALDDCMVVGVMSWCKPLSLTIVLVVYKYH